MFSGGSGNDQREVRRDQGTGVDPWLSAINVNASITCTALEQLGSQARARESFQRVPPCVYIYRGIWRPSPHTHKIYFENLKKISYEPRRNLLVSPLIKNLLR
jgi:hypothetical protein